MRDFGIIRKIGFSRSRTCPSGQPFWALLFLIFPSDFVLLPNIRKILLDENKDLLYVHISSGGINRPA